jgi:hypothetical protein
MAVGYYSVRYLETVGKWLMLYAAPDPDPNRGNSVFARTADFPWGPWSYPLMVLPFGEGYGKWMQAPPPLKDDDKNRVTAYGPNPFEDEKRKKDQIRPNEPLAPEGAIREPGAPYAPFLLPAHYSRVLSGRRTIVYFTLSTWNPYQTILMKAALTLG